MNAMTPIRSRKGRKAKPAAITLPAWDKGAEGAANQERLRTEPATVEDADTGREVLTGGKRRRRQSWVQIYARKGWITQTQLLAAERLARAEFRKLWALVPTASKPVMQRVVLDDQAIWSDCGEAGRQRHLQRLGAGLDAIA